MCVFTKQNKSILRKTIVTDIGQIGSLRRSGNFRVDYKVGKYFTIFVVSVVNFYFVTQHRLFVYFICFTSLFY